MKRILDGMGSWIFPLLAVVAFLFLTPIGGYINLLVSGIAILSAAYLCLEAVLELFRFRDYSDADHWKGIGRKVVGICGLLIFVIAIQLVMPTAPPLLSRDCSLTARGQVPC